MRTSSPLLTLAAGAILLAAAVAIPLAAGNQYYLQILANIGINIILVLGLNVITGLAGQLSLCQGAFFGIGAYACALLVMKAGLSFWLALPTAALGTAVLGLAVSIPALRLRGHYLAMLTLAFTVIVAQVLTNWVDMTRGPSGLINIPWPDDIPLGFAEINIATRNQYYVFIVLMVGLMAYLAALIQRSRLGMSLTAIREDEVAAEIMGINTQVCKVAAFALSAFFGAVAGGLYAHYAKILTPEEFGVLQSVNILIMMIIGGVGSVAGAIVGAVVFTILPEALRLFNDYRLIIFGLVLVLVIIYFPHGIVGTVRGWLRGGASRSTGADAAARSGNIPPVHQAPPPAVDGELLRVEGVTKRFGGLTALNGVDLQARGGEVVGLIGPNGSGKTTLINVISGAYGPTHGRVLLNRDVISGRPAYRISHAGVSRTFQKIRLFKELTVRENVAAALCAEPRQDILAPLRAGRLIGRPSSMPEAVGRLLATVGLEHRSEDVARSLSYGEQRLLEIARALATRPRLILLDEPAAGLSEVDVEFLRGVIGRLRQMGITLILVDHHVTFLMSVVDRVVVLDQGRVIFDGAATDARRDPRVIDAYLGAAAHAA